jgi:hypothetical protein
MQLKYVLLIMLSTVVNNASAITRGELAIKMMKASADKMIERGKKWLEDNPKKAGALTAFGTLLGNKVLEKTVEKVVDTAQKPFETTEEKKEKPQLTEEEIAKLKALADLLDKSKK